MRFPRLVLFWLLIGSLQSPARGADITAPMLNLKAFQADNSIDILEPSDPVRCDLILDGMIAEGDAAKLGREFEANSSINGSGIISYFLCLRSSGGDAVEALKIARFVLNNRRPSMATVIEDGKTCASACALIFLAGNEPLRHGGRPARYLHPRGRLIFHSTRLDTSLTDQQILDFLSDKSDGGGLKDKLYGFYESALRTEQSIISTFQTFIYEGDDLEDRWVRPSLFLEMFAQDPNELLCIDTVDAAGRWGIDVYGYTGPKTLTNKNYADVCYNTYNWRLDKFVADAFQGEEDTINETQIKTTSSKTDPGAKNGLSVNRRTTVPYETAFSQTTCVIHEKRQAGESTSEYTVSFASTTGSAAPDPLAFLPASTLLPDLPGVRQTPAPVPVRGVPRNFASQTSRLMNGCSFRRIPAASLDDCQAKCAADAICVGYSYNKINQMCEFKHTLTSLRIDPMWISGIPATAPISKESSRAIHMKYPSIDEDQVLNGTVIEAEKVGDDSDTGETGEELCKKKCETDKACVAVEYDGSNSRNICERFSSITGLRKVSSPNFASAYIKTQD